MLDIIVRLLLSAGILIGTTYLPSLSQAVVGHRPTDASATLESARSCPTTTLSTGRLRAVACLV